MEWIEEKSKDKKWLADYYQSRAQHHFSKDKKSKAGKHFEKAAKNLKLKQTYKNE